MRGFFKIYELFLKVLAATGSRRCFKIWDEEGCRLKLSKGLKLRYSLLLFYRIYIQSSLYFTSRTSVV